MSKRKREQSISVASDKLDEESTLKKEKKDILNNEKPSEKAKSVPNTLKPNTTENGGENEDNVKSQPVEKKVSDEKKSPGEKLPDSAELKPAQPENGESNTSTSKKQSVNAKDSEGAVNGAKSGTKRRREEEAVPDADSKRLKLNLEKSVKEAKERKKAVIEKLKRAGYKRRISKNSCVCSPIEESPLKSAAENTDAHIQVDEWRLHKVQSPIELNHEESIHHDHFEPLEFHGHWDDDGQATFYNNGFTATLRFQNRELPILKGGPLHEDEYIFEQLHFHWSEDDHSGCEHIFEGRAYSMEAHAVHYNLKYKDFMDAHDKPDGLAVVAFFLQATDNDDNPCFSKLTTAVKDIIKVKSTTNVPPDCLTWFKEEAQCKGYYTYQGSLTTEPYTESVTWILYPQPIHVSRDQVASFRSLNSTPCEKHNIKQNVRPIQTPPQNRKLNVLFARSHKLSSSE